MNIEKRFIRITKENEKKVVELLEKFGFSGVDHEWKDENKDYTIYTEKNRETSFNFNPLGYSGYKEVLYVELLDFYEKLEKEKDLEQRTIRCNNKEYRIYCHKNMSGSTKYTGAFKISFGVDVYDVDNQKWLDWKDLKNTYLLEKIQSFLLNSANGKRSIY
ncbi:MAG: hypothetical protein ACRC7R_01740 [Sarcina sp.]